MDDEEALFQFARRGTWDDVRGLLGRGVLPDRRMAYDGSKPVAMARNGSRDVVRLLIGRRASLDHHIGNVSALLTHAVSGGGADAVQGLLMDNAHPNEPDDDEVTPLVLAASNGSLEVAKRLVDAKADVDAIPEGWGSALDGATESEHREVVARFESIGAKRSDAEHSQGRHNISAEGRRGYDAFDGGRGH